LTEIFEQYTAKLSKINPNYYISSMIHKTKISVDERGTTAVATTTSIFENKSAPQRFLANRPFLYFIVEKNTNLILFAGQYVNPNPNSDTEVE
jgi:serine protease inhibitor